MVNQNKYYEVDNIKALLGEAKSAALIDYQGLTAEQLRQLRAEVKQNGGVILVEKNTLLTIGLKQMGINLPVPLTGPTAIVVGQQDEVAPFKIVDKLRRQLEKPEFKLGIYQGKALSLAELLEFISLPGKEVLLAQFVGGLANPLQRLIGGLNYHQTKLVLVLKAISKKQAVN